MAVSALLPCDCCRMWGAGALAPPQAAWRGSDTGVWPAGARSVGVHVVHGHADGVDVAVGGIGNQHSRAGPGPQVIHHSLVEQFAGEGRWDSRG